VRENIVRHLQMGKDHFMAARDGTSEIGLAVLATTFSIVAVFVPVAFMKGIVGRYFFQFGTTVAFAVLVSLFVSFTLDPMLSSRWKDPDIAHTGRRRWFVRILDHFNAGFEWVADHYRGVIGWAMDHRPTTVFLAIMAFAGGMILFTHLPTAFMPDWDRGEFQAKFKTSPGASFEESKGRLRAILADLDGIPEIKDTYATIGAGDAGTVRSGSVYIKLVDKSKRSRSQEEILGEVRQRLQTIPGIQLSVEAESHNGAQKPVLIEVRGENIDLLKELALELKKRLYNVPGLVDLEASMEFDEPEYRMVVDRQRTADAGVMSQDISRALGTLVGGIAVSTFEDQEGENVDVRLRLPHDLRKDVSQLGDLRIVGRDHSGKPKLLALDELVRTERSTTPVEIDRRTMTRIVKVSANLAGIPLGAAMGPAVEIIKSLQMPPGYSAGFAGEADDMAETFSYMAEALLLAVISVYLILAAQFESFLDPLAIMLSLPLSILGMSGMLWFTGDTVNIMSLIGLIMLMGLVTKNAILLVDYAKFLRGCGMPRREAVIAAGRIRLRPIMMTTMAMILGMMPMALKIGSGAEFRAPMARAVVGGLVTSTFLTLLVVPVVYTLLDDVEVWLLRKFKAKSPAEEHRQAA
jgi:HAE1 family hydrophobic/amphiphilic exporter-1